MKTHELKIDAQYFAAVMSGDKTFEVRKNDRGFQVGDRVLLYEMVRDWNPENPNYVATGRYTLREITYILDDPAYVKDGFVIFGIKPV